MDAMQLLTMITVCLIGAAFVPLCLQMGIEHKPRKQRKLEAEAVDRAFARLERPWTFEEMDAAVEQELRMLRKSSS